MLLADAVGEVMERAEMPVSVRIRASGGAVEVSATVDTGNGGGSTYGLALGWPDEWPDLDVTLTPERAARVAKGRRPAPSWLPQLRGLR